MFISRHKYERDLKEAYENGRYEAEERGYRERSFERFFDKLDQIENRVRKLEREKNKKNEPAVAVPEGCPFD